MMQRLVAPVVLWICLVSTWAHAQVYYPRAELQKPLSQAVEKALADFVEKCAQEKQTQLATHMESVMKTVGDVVKLTDEEKAAMKAKNEAALAAALEAWKPEVSKSMRIYLSRSSESSALRSVNAWKPTVAGINETVENWTPPQETQAWLDGLSEVVGAERFKVWQKAYAEERQKLVDKVNQYLEGWVREAYGPMKEGVQQELTRMREGLKLSDEQIGAVTQALEQRLETISKTERERAVKLLVALPEDARAFQMGGNGYRLRFDRPRGEAWDKMVGDVVTQVLNPERGQEWAQVVKEFHKKEEAELLELLKPSETYARQRMEIKVANEVDGIATDLGLNQERLGKLKKIGEKAVEESMRQSLSSWTLLVRNYSTSERKRVRNNVYFGVDDDKQALALDVWKNGLKELLTTQEQETLKQELQGREKRVLSALARMCLAEMDQTLMLNDEQRAKLEPLLLPAMEPMLAQRREEYWGLTTAQLMQAAARVKKEALEPLLDEVQEKHWHELINTQDVSRQAQRKAGALPEVPDVEVAISEHLYKMYVAERKKKLATTLSQIEEAQRLLGLSQSEVKRLMTAAKGAVESSMSYWRQNMERYVRQMTQNANGKNVLQMLSSTGRVSFSRGEADSPQETDVWKMALKTELDAAQRAELVKVAKVRRNYRLNAMAAMTVSELDRRRRLTTTQCGKVEDAVAKVLEDYETDLGRYMSGNLWCLQYYYAIVPVAGVPEKEMQAILSPAKWKEFKERDLPDAMQYWESIENNHKNRLRKNNFDGGMFIE